MRRAPSLRLRLVAGSLAWVLLSLAATGILLILLFRGHIERRFDMALHDHLEELAAAAEIEGDELRLSWEPADPRFKSPRSGWYWELRAGGETLRRSPSLVGAMLEAQGPGRGQPQAFSLARGPAGEWLRVIAQDILFPEREEPVTVLVAGPLSDIHDDVLRFAGSLALSLSALALALGALVFVQLGYGLRPLARLQAALNDVRLGRSQALDEAASPAEVRPLSEEVNALLRQREAMVERARAEAGDLAHALKTPIAVIGNEARQIAGESGAVLAAEAARMRRVVEHHLVRARAAAGVAPSGQRAALADVLEDVRFGLARLHPGRTVAIEAGNGLAFAGAVDDLGEMIGNLAENAAKWAVSRVLIRAVADGGRLKVSVEDDGPGIEEAQRRMALERGGRLDMQKPGHGFGLSIVVQLAELHGGRLELSRSPLGGLRADLDLPLAAEGNA